MDVAVNRIEIACDEGLEFSTLTLMIDGESAQLSCTQDLMGANRELRLNGRLITHPDDQRTMNVFIERLMNQREGSTLHSPNLPMPVMNWLSKCIEERNSSVLEGYRSPMSGRGMLDVTWDVGSG